VTVILSHWQPVWGGGEASRATGRAPSRCL